MRAPPQGENWGPPRGWCGAGLGARSPGNSGQLNSASLLIRSPFLNGPAWRAMKRAAHIHHCPHIVWSTPDGVGQALRTLRLALT